jgi:hypothetical protein
MLRDIESTRQAKYVRDMSAGAQAVSVPCLECGRMVRLSAALIDPNGPAFRAYYHEDCVEKVTN